MLSKFEGRLVMKAVSKVLAEEYNKLSKMNAKDVNPIN